MTTYAVHTANTGWLSHPETFAHIAHALGVQVLIQKDIALSDDEYRVYCDDGPISRTTHIDEECGKRIRHAIERHLQQPAAVKEDKPQPTPQLQQHGNQLSLF